MKTQLLFTFVLFGLTSGIHLYAQDTTLVMTDDQFFRAILDFHPVARQAALLDSKGKQTLQKARGGFDPYIFSNLNQKAYDKKNYFRLLSSGFKVPTRFGAEIKGGFDQAEGVFLNPENTIPTSGLWYAGVSLPVGQGLFIDQRRTDMQQARIFAASTEAQRRLILNDLVYESAKAYWNWVNTWNQLSVYQEAVSLTRVRLSGVRESFILGDKPAIDTLEALIQLQTRELDLNQARIDYRNASLSLSAFLWNENNQPLVIGENVVPVSANQLTSGFEPGTDSLAVWLNNLSRTHPALQTYTFKLADLNVEKRWKSEKLKPTFDLNYNVLSVPEGGEYANGFLTENYKWGFTFSMPILLRKARGDLQLTQIKIQETQLQRNQKQLELTNKVLAYQNELLNLKSQIDLFTSAVANYARLLEGERRKFELGESSLFLVNARESKLIESRIKLIDLQTKYQKIRAGRLWALGGLADSFE